MEIDLNELDRLANAAHKYNRFWFEKDDFEDLNIGSDDAALIARMSHDVVLELVRRLRTAEAEAVKSEQFSLAVLESEWANGYAAALKDAACGIRALEVKPS